MRRAWITFVVLVGLLGAASEAGAATASLTLECYKYGCPQRLYYVAAPGEANSVTATQEGDLVTIRDVVSVVAGENCEALDATTVRCAFADDHWSGDSASFATGDRDDVLDARGVAVWYSLSPSLLGGSGADTLYGPEAVSGAFYGGSGDDVMVGGPRPDRFYTGARRDGSDRIVGGDARLDHSPLGGNFDHIDYRSRRRPVRVALNGKADDGERDERDNVSGVEWIEGGDGGGVLIGGAGAETLIGGAGRDTLRGGPGPDRLIGDESFTGSGQRDRLEGGRGADILDGRGGRDVLIGGPGRDTIDGGAGADRMHARDRNVDWVLCGLGDDVLFQDRVDAVMRGCERRRGSTRREPAPVAAELYESGLVMIVGCPVTRSRGCVSQLRIELDGRTLGVADFDLPPGTAARLSAAPRWAQPEQMRADLTRMSAIIASEATPVAKLPAEVSTDSFLDIWADRPPALP